MTNDIVIDLSRVAKKFGQHFVLEDVTYQVQRGGAAFSSNMSPAYCMC